MGEEKRSEAGRASDGGPESGTEGSQGMQGAEVARTPTESSALTRVKRDCYSSPSASV